MTSTGDAIASGGANVRFVLAIEAFDKLLTDAEDPSKAVTAWAATAWTAALPGLKFGGQVEQKISPFDEKIDVSVLTFEITPDDDDVFGKAVWRSKPAFETRLTNPFAATTGATNIQGKSFAALPSSGSVYIGRLRINYASKTGSQQLNINANQVGVFAPFTANGATNWPWHFPTSPGQDGDVAANPKITNTPQVTSWRGRWVGLYMHKANGPAWATKAEAECVWAGRIAEMMQGPNGTTILQCEEMRGAIRDCVLLQRQFHGKVKEGIYLETGSRFRFDEGGSKVSNWFTIGTDLAAGFYSLETLFGKLNEFIADEKATVRIDQTWTLAVVATDSGYRTRIQVNTGDEDRPRGFQFICSEGKYLDFMGFETRTRLKNGYSIEIPPKSEIYSDEAPLRVMAMQRHTADKKFARLELESSRGSWVTHSAYLPQPVRGWVKGDDRSYIMLGDDGLAFAKKSGSLEFTEIRRDDPLSRTLRRENKGSFFRRGKTYDESGDLDVRQVVVISGPVSFILTALLASIEGTGVNHADYDVFPFGAGIPWELLGDSWINSLKSLEETGPTDGMMVVLDKPTPLAKVLMSQLMLRWGFLVYRNNGLQVVSPPIPNAAYADHELDESNQTDPDVAVRLSKDWLVNVIKIEHDRLVGTDEYRKTWIIEDSVSVAQFGERVVTIRTRDTYAGASDCGVDLEALVGALAGRVFPSFGRPLLVIRRTLLGDKWLTLTPGQTGTLTAPTARNPTDGSLGVGGEGGMQERGVTVLEQWHDWAQGGGELASEVTLMYSEEDRAFPMGPAGDLNVAASTNTVLKIQQHAFSQTGDPKDVERWQVGDAYRVLERDPDDPANPDTFTGLVIDVDVANDEIEINNGFGTGGRPAKDNSKRYVLIYDDYVASDDDQLLTAFQADDADGLIQDVIEPNEFADDGLLVYAATAGTELYERYADVQSGDGEPFPASLARQIAVASNVLTNHKTTQCHAFRLNTFVDSVTTPVIVQCWPFPIGFGVSPAGYKRLFTISVDVELANSGDTGFIRITTSKVPPTGETSVVSFQEPFRQITFTHTGTTTRTIKTAQTLEPIPALPGVTFVTVEFWVLTAGDIMSFYGCPQFDLGPVEDA